ncbi:hypothetical protein SAMN05720470_10839 [Fibrobacter sp. UWOV1]|uniref:major capsid family protein n=1 Tax=Fibrobacter sp. UWOV1 TaxID=1896215 RepID=UPI000911916E|nr:major capsid family protein [Fibrobacter sp. UWOV1]SHL42167.1 hypothetical protein SAMN05720470_10839 [Fibrobacter sp. UWOV1]
MPFNTKQNAAILALFGVIAKETYGLDREALHATEFVPMQTGVAPFAGSFSYKVISDVGMAKFVADYADDLPPVGRFLKIESAGIRTLAISYAYSNVELEQYLTAGIDVSRDDAISARHYIDKKVDEVILIGDADQGLTGLFNNENVTVVASPNNAAGTSTKIKNKDLSEIVKTVQTMVDGAYALNKGTIVLDSIIWDHEAYAYLSTTPVSAQNSTSILNYLKEIFREQGIVNWNESRKLDEIGGGRAVLYKKAPTIVSYILPIPFKQEEAQAHALHYKVPCYARVGGTIIKNIKGIIYCDGV